MDEIVTNGLNRSGPDRVCIIGGGVSGFTTGIVLQLLGYRVRIVADRVMDEPNLDDPKSGDPRFASVFPAASIIPHTVAVSDESWHVNTSMRFFSALQFAGTAGVRKQRHYEIFETPVLSARYARLLNGFKEYANGTSDQSVPRRRECERVWGWSFDCFFAEMPQYRAWLRQMFGDLGGRVESERHVTLEMILSIPEPIVINCAGFGAGLLSGASDLTFVKGILVKVFPDTPALLDGVWTPVSYNYTPRQAIYQRSSGEAADVYCYPRLDAWILGGTRLVGVFDPSGRWVGEELYGPTIVINGVDVPQPVIEVNRDIILSLVGLDIAECPRTAVMGYRCVRDASHGGVRLESEHVRNSLVVHNYGHGGAGVTLSWSSAIRVASLISTIGLGAQPKTNYANDIQRFLARLVDDCLSQVS